MSTYDTNLMDLVRHYGNARVAAARPHPLDATRGKEETEYLLGIIQAKIDNKPPPFERGDQVMVMKDFVQACNSDFIPPKGKIYCVGDMIYQHGGWCIKTEGAGSRLFNARDFKKVQVSVSVVG